MRPHGQRLIMDTLKISSALTEECGTSNIYSIRCGCVEGFATRQQKLLQLGVFGFSGDEDGDAGVGVFP